jgi:ketosteroid isomerase-like protein
MARKIFCFVAALAITHIFVVSAVYPQNNRGRMRYAGCASASGLSGVYRIDPARSDQLYSVIEGASSRVPYGEQQEFFMDLAVRLTPPDLLALECRGGGRISLGSSRAPRAEFVADGATRNARTADGRVVRTRIAFERGSLTFTSSGQADDNLTFTFTPLENGRRLQVTRRLSSEELNQPLVIRTIYGKISDSVRWDFFNEPAATAAADEQIAGQEEATRSSQTDANSNDSRPPARVTIRDEADALRDALGEWIAATNDRDIEKQMSFYAPRLSAYYLARDAARDAVRAEKTRVFSGVRSVSIRAEEPEIIFQDGGRTAVMRFRKRYRINEGARNRAGEVVQELRWRRTNAGWKITSERDIRVIR